MSFTEDKNKHNELRKFYVLHV